MKASVTSPRNRLRCLRTFSLAVLKNRLAEESVFEGKNQRDDRVGLSLGNRVDAGINQRRRKECTEERRTRRGLLDGSRDVAGRLGSAEMLARDAGHQPKEHGHHGGEYLPKRHLR